MNTKEAITYWNEKLSETVREEISDDYDNKSINLDDIVNKYKLPFDKSKLPALVLPKQTDVKCKWCGEVLFIKRRRSTSKYYTNYEYCINCGHINNASCTCSKCVEMRARQEKQKRVAEEQRRKEKRNRIINKYGNTAPIAFDSLSLFEKVTIGIILFHTSGKREFVLEDYDAKMYPADADISILTQMFQKAILIISDDVDPDAFSDDLESCDFAKLRLTINTEIDEGEIERLVKGRIGLSKKDFRLLWQYIASLQLKEYLIKIMNKYNFMFSPGEKTMTVINDMLEHFSVSEGMQLIHSATMRACARYQAGGISRKHAANIVITICKDYLRRALDEGWSVKKFRREYDSEISTAEFYIYSIVLNIGEDGFKCSPGRMSDKLYKEVFLKKYQDDTQA